MADIQTPSNRKFWAKNSGVIDPPRFAVHPRYYAARELWLAQAVYHRDLVRWEEVVDKWDREAARVEWLSMEGCPGTFR